MSRPVLNLEVRLKKSEAAHSFLLIAEHVAALAALAPKKHRGIAMAHSQMIGSLMTESLSVERSADE